MADPVRGEVWLGDLGPTRGHEDADGSIRRASVLYTDSFHGKVTRIHGKGADTKK
jgi:hypothetical protein